MLVIQIIRQEKPHIAEPFTSTVQPLPRTTSSSLRSTINGTLTALVETSEGNFYQLRTLTICSATNPMPRLPSQRSVRQNSQLPKRMEKSGVRTTSCFLLMRLLENHILFTGFGTGLLLKGLKVRLMVRWKCTRAAWTSTSLRRNLSRPTKPPLDPPASKTLTVRGCRNMCAIFKTVGTSSSFLLRVTRTSLSFVQLRLLNLLQLHLQSLRRHQLHLPQHHHHPVRTPPAQFLFHSHRHYPHPRHHLLPQNHLHHLPPQSHTRLRLHSLSLPQSPLHHQSRRLWVGNTIQHHNICLI